VNVREVSWHILLDGVEEPQAEGMRFSRRGIFTRGKDMRSVTEPYISRYGYLIKPPCPPNRDFSNAGGASGLRI
jgi:hypothetical protein